MFESPAPVPELWGPGEVAAHLGRSRQRAAEVMASPSFPEPVAVLGIGRVWRAGDVRAWSAANPRRPLTRDQDT